MLKLIGIVLALASVAGFADGQVQPVKVTLSAKDRVYHALADVVLEIRISNPSSEGVSVRTNDTDPPVYFHAVYLDGRLAIKTVLLPKNGTTKNVDYALGPGRARTYMATIGELLRKDQKIDRADAGEVNVSVDFPIVRYEDGAYKVIQVPSNTVTVVIAP